MSKTTLIEKLNEKTVDELLELLILGLGIKRIEKEESSKLKGEFKIIPELISGIFIINFLISIKNKI